MEKQSEIRIAVVTGGSSGIGKAIAEKLSEAGIKVVAADIVDNNAGESSPNLFFRKCDITNPVEIDQLYKWTIKHLGTPEILVLNAGRGIQEQLITGDPEKWQRVIDINLMGPLRCIRAFIPAMLETGRGNVVFISSVAANRAFPYGGIYSASKSALEVIAETLRLETLPKLNVTVLSPGIVNTDFFRNQISGKTSPETLGMGFLSPTDIAEDVWYALNKTQGTSINKIITRPIEQDF